MSDYTLEPGELLSVQAPLHKVEVLSGDATNGLLVVRIRTESHEFEVFVSRTGRSVRLYRDMEEA